MIKDPKIDEVPDNSVYTRFNRFKITIISNTVRSQRGSDFRYLRHDINWVGTAPLGIRRPRDQPSEHSLIHKNNFIYEAGWGTRDVSLDLQRMCFNRPGLPRRVSLIRFAISFPSLFTGLHPLKLIRGKDIHI